MVHSEEANPSWVLTDLSNEYKEACLNFDEEKALDCIKENIDFFKYLNKRVMIMGQKTLLIEYRTRFQRLIELLMGKNELTRSVPCLKKKLDEVIKKKGSTKALQHLTQVIIRVLVLGKEVFAKKGTTEEAGVIVF